MALWKPDPTFYPSARMAMAAPVETLAYVVTFDPKKSKPDALCAIDLDPKQSSYGKIVGRIEMPKVGDELHHFGWNACSAALCPYAPHPHVERRYLIVPGLRSSRIYIIDTKPYARNPRIVRVIEPEEIASKTGYSRAAYDSLRARRAFTSARSALPMATDRAEFSCSITRASMCWADGKSIADRRRWPMISGGISDGTSRSPANGARPT